MEKIKFLIITTIMSVLFLTVPVYASTTDYNDVYTPPDFYDLLIKEDGTTYDFIIKANNWHSQERGEPHWNLIIVDTPQHSTRYNNPEYSNPDFSYVKFYTCDKGSNIWTLYRENYTGYLTIGCPFDDYQVGQSYDECILYSSYDILYDSEVVFQSPSQRTLSRVTQAIPRTLRREILKSLGYLAKLLISLVILLVSLRKALNFLQKELLM